MIYAIREMIRTVKSDTRKQLNIFVHYLLNIQDGLTQH